MDKSLICRGSESSEANCTHTASLPATSQGSNEAELMHESSEPRKGVSLCAQPCFFGSGNLDQGATQRPEVPDFSVYMCLLGYGSTVYQLLRAPKIQNRLRIVALDGYFKESQSSSVYKKGSIPWQDSPISIQNQSLSPSFLCQEQSFQRQCLIMPTPCPRIHGGTLQLTGPG